MMGANHFKDCSSLKAFENSGDVEWLKKSSSWKLESGNRVFFVAFESREGTKCARFRPNKLPRGRSLGKSHSSEPRGNREAVGFKNRRNRMPLVGRMIAECEKDVRRADTLKPRQLRRRETLVQFVAACCCTTSTLSKHRREKNSAAGRKSCRMHE